MMHSKHAVLQRVEELFAAASARFSGTLSIPPVDRTLSEAEAFALFAPGLDRVRQFLAGYESRFVGEARDATQSADWLVGWSECKGDVAKLKAVSAAERRSVEEMKRAFKRRRPAIEGATR